MIKIKKIKKFDNDVKHLRKKYKEIKKDLMLFKEIVSSNPEAGKSLGHSLYKLRLKNSSKNIGKSGGFRVIYYYVQSDKLIYVLSIYDKSEIENISTRTLMKIVDEEL